MNILHVLSQYEVNGVETHVATIAEERARNGLGLTIVSDTFSTPVPVEVLYRPIGKRDYRQRISNIAFLINLIKKKNIQIVNAHSRAASWVSYFATRFTRTPLISTIHMRQHMHLSTKHVPVYGEKLIPVCKAISDHLQEDLGYTPDRLALIHNAIDLDHWTFDPHRANRSGRKIVSFVGRFSGFKGDNLLVIIDKIFPEVLKQYGNIQFHIVGGISGTARIVEAVERTNRAMGREFIFLKGFTTELRKVYQEADVVIGSGRVAMEALASGNLVVSIGEGGDIGIISERTRDRAVYSNFGDLDTRKPINIENSVRSIVTALEHPDIVEPAWGRKLIREQYDSKAVIAMLNGLYDTLTIHRHPAPASTREPGHHAVVEI